MLTGLPGAGKTFNVRTFVDQWEKKQRFHAKQSPSPGGCAWLESDDASVVVLGKWSGYHYDRSIGQTKDAEAGRAKPAYVPYVPGGDGTDQLGGPPAPTSELIASCIEAVAAPRRRNGKAGLVVADGLLFLLSDLFVEAMAASGFEVLIRELDVDEETAEARRAQRDGENTRWECDEMCEMLFRSMRMRPQWARLAEDGAVPLMLELAESAQVDGRIRE